LCRSHRLKIWTLERRCIDTEVHVVYNSFESRGNRRVGPRARAGEPRRQRTLLRLGRDRGGDLMGPAEIIASLKELCEDEGPRLSTQRIVDWIEWHGGFESDAEL